MEEDEELEADIKFVRDEQERMRQEGITEDMLKGIFGSLLRDKIDGIANEGDDDPDEDAKENVSDDSESEEEKPADDSKDSMDYDSSDEYVYEEQQNKDGKKVKIKIKRKHPGKKVFKAMKFWGKLKFAL